MKGAVLSGLVWVDAGSDSMLNRRIHVFVAFIGAVFGTNVQTYCITKNIKSQKVKVDTKQKCIIYKYVVVYDLIKYNQNLNYFHWIMQYDMVEMNDEFLLGL